MLNFFIVSSIGILAIFITCLVTYEILRKVWKILPSLSLSPYFRVSLIVIPIFAIHIINIWIYAGFYFLIENFTLIGMLVGQRASGLDYESFLECLYFSSSTYTALGFGDITPTKDLRMLSAAEVLNGLVMIGWTISFTYLTMEKFWTLPHSRRQPQKN